MDGGIRWLDEYDIEEYELGNDGKQMEKDYGEKCEGLGGGKN